MSHKRANRIVEYYHLATEMIAINAGAKIYPPNENLQYFIKGERGMDTTSTYLGDKWVETDLPQLTILASKAHMFLSYSA